MTDEMAVQMMTYEHNERPGKKQQKSTEVEKSVTRTIVQKIAVQNDQLIPE